MNSYGDADIFSIKNVVHKSEVLCGNLKCIALKEIPYLLT